MQAMILIRPAEVDSNPLTPEIVNDPRPGPGQIMVKVAACGVCHTDLHTVEGELDLPRLPLIPGHQIVGTVQAVGSGADEALMGRRVGIPWMNSVCGDCEFCRMGLENLCPQARFTGLHVDGGYAQYAVVDASFAFPLPSSFSDTEAAPLLCAGIIGYRSLRLSTIEPNQRLGLFGFGASAHIAIQLARHWGCRVAVFTRGAEHRRLALQLGAEWAGSADERPPFPLDSAITFAPVGALVPLALKQLRPGGTLAINAVHMSPIPELAYDLIYGERTLRSVANFTRTDARELLTLAERIPIRTEVECFPLAEANLALQSLKRSAIRGSAVLTVPQ